MNIIIELLKEFFINEQSGMWLIIFLSFIINILQINGTSYLTASIIQAVEKNASGKTYESFYYFIATSVAILIIYYIYRIVQNDVLTKLRHWIRHELVKKMLLFNREEFDEINFTKLISPINRVSTSSFVIFNSLVSEVLPNITLLLMIAMYFIYKNTIFGVTFLISNIFMLSYLYLYWDEIISLKREYEQHMNKTEAYLIEILNNIDKIVYRGESLNEIDRFSETTTMANTKAKAYYSNVNYHTFICYLIVYLITACSIFYLIYLCFNKEITSTIFITFFTILLLYRDRVTTMIQQIIEYIDFIGRAESVIDVFDNMKMNGKKLEEKTYKKHDLTFDNIRYENVSFQYTNENKLAFEKLNININTNNKIIGITGLSGNGKSTFAKLLLKMFKPKSGNIYIDGVNMNEIDGDYIRKNVTYVNQNSKLFDRKVIDNILYGCNDEALCKQYLNEIMKYQRINGLFRNIDIHNKKAGLLGENLSGGQRQAVNLISGLVNPSKIIILDEPTNALDVELKKEVIALIQDFKKYKKCVFVISHDKDVFPIFDESIKI